MAIVWATCVSQQTGYELEDFVGTRSFSACMPCRWQLANTPNRERTLQLPSTVLPTPSPYNHGTKHPFYLVMFVYMVQL